MSRSMEAAIVLFAHGSRDPEWAVPFERLKRMVEARAPGRCVALAYLEAAAPTLGEAIDAAVAAGARSVRVVPLFLAPGGHTRRDLPPLLEAARARHPGVAVDATATIGESPEMLAALADWIGGPA